jgi:hypothetical protein
MDHLPLSDKEDISNTFIARMPLMMQSMQTYLPEGLTRGCKSQRVSPDILQGKIPYSA